MIVVELSGGMGNQMFQYAFGRYLALKHNTELYLDTHYLLDRNSNSDIIFRNYDLSIFNIKATIASENISKEFGHLRSSVVKVKQKLLKSKKLEIVTEKGMTILSDFENLTDNIYLKGYWQNYLYFDSILEVIKEDFSFIEPIDEKSLNLLKEIKQTNSVCLNVRRADFVTNESHRALDVSYFKEAESIISAKVSNPIFFVFSDDIEWCKENIKLEFETHFIEHKYAGKKFKDYLNLMINCTHYIIPNSSFAWWAVWLSNSKNKIVIAPKIWLHSPTIDTHSMCKGDWILI